jgi:hypothetical protein
MNLALLRVDIVNKMSLISESGAETQGNIHPAWKNLNTTHVGSQRPSMWQQFAMTIKDSVRVPPLPSARLPCDTSLGYPWVAHTLS